MRIGLIVLLLVLGLFVLTCLGGGCMLYGSYNKAIKLDEGVQSSWADIEVVLKRRYDLIPNIVETVKGYAGHEKELFENLAKSREKYFTASTPSAKARAAGGLESALSRLLVLRETYPELKANENFRALQIELEGTENRIAEMRKRYNGAAKALNTHIRRLMGSLVASWADIEKADYFEAGEVAQETPKVDFSSS